MWNGSFFPLWKSVCTLYRLFSWKKKLIFIVLLRKGSAWKVLTRYGFPGGTDEFFFLCVFGSVGATGRIATTFNKSQVSLV